MLNRNIKLEPHQECVLIFAPTGQDAGLLAKVLTRDGIACELPRSDEALFTRLEQDVGALVVAEEALKAPFIAKLNAILDAQEPWSDLPLVIMTSGGETTLTSMRVLKAFTPAGNVTLLERPFRSITLVSALQVSLRARRRQYQVRSLLQKQAEATRMRDEFISVASHELKTPLTSLKLQTQLNRRMIFREQSGALGTPGLRVDKLVDSTEKQVDRLVRLVEDMLDISRITTGKLAMVKSEVDFGELVLEVLDRLKPQLDGAGCVVHVNVATGIVGRWDHYRIEQVISNLLMNVVRYSPGTELWVELGAKENTAELLVRDSGPGIAKENQERIFQRFERASNTRSISGLGLGLYICREILESHGGSISVESELGKGAAFLVTLPLG